jgi:hypothetical protein
MITIIIFLLFYHRLILFYFCNINIIIKSIIISHLFNKCNLLIVKRFISFLGLHIYGYSG